MHAFYGIYQWLEHNGFVKWTATNLVAGTGLEVIHYFSFFVVVGSMFSVDLRLLGLTGTSHSLRQVANRAFPALWVALIFNLISGFFMFAGTAVSYYDNGWFYFKMAALLAALITVFVVRKNISGWDQPTIPLAGKITAVLSILLWIGTILVAVEVPALTGVG
jgi:hypothetical protein